MVKSRLCHLIHLILLKSVAWSGWLCSAYYTIISKAFRSEQHAMVAGMLRYDHTTRNKQGNIFLLKRNIHRLEKGLSARTRKPVFGLQFISETVTCFVACAGSDPALLQQPALAWAADVLQAYFANVTAPSPIIDEARKQFYQSLPPDYSGHNKIPYQRGHRDSPVSYEDFQRLCEIRRSIRWFQPAPVDRTVLDDAFRIAGLAPSACNRQPFHYTVFDDARTVKKIAQLVAGTQDFYQNIPVLLVLIGDLSAFSSERDRHIIYIDASLSAMSLMYALETLGLSSCPINWPDIAAQDTTLATWLHLQQHERAIMLIAIGYADPEGLVAYSQKKELSEVRSFHVPLT